MSNKKTITAGPTIPFLGPKLCECGPEPIMSTITTTSNSFIEDSIETRLPGYISIIGKIFTVIQVDKLDNTVLEDNNDGECDYSQQTIKIRMGRATDCIKDTILHEAIHGIEIALDLDLSEKQVMRLATGLIALFNDNPELKNLLLSD